MTHPRVVCLAGAGSESGRVWEVFDGIIRYLSAAGAYDRADFLETSYRVGSDGAPLPYTQEDASAPLAVASGTVARSLQWIRREGATRLHLLGWSLGGVVLFDAAAALVQADPTWARDLGAIVTLASPLLGSDLDGIDLFGAMAAGPAGADLARRAADEDEKSRVRRSAARLRAAGIRVVTLAAEGDAVVTPEDALLPAVGPEPSAFVLRPRRRSNAPYIESILGHGALPHDPVCWQCVLAAFGPAE
ncbi:MAG TPA: hypothetical protein VNL16_09995 [Chloroflexota bacterium]|nr:hypothetical protein [Chloroflexota bacterium]